MVDTPDLGSGAERFEGSTPSLHICYTVSMKTCIKCREEKSLEEFSKDGSVADGLRRYCKECAKIYRANYYKNNREKELAQNAIWHEEHAEELLEYREGRKEISAIIGKRWNKANPEKRREYVKRYRKKFPEKHREKNMRRYAVKKNAQTEKVSYSEIRLRDKDQCYICGTLCFDNIGKSILPYRLDGLQFEHIISIMDGGAHNMKNIRVGCAQCNSSGEKGRKPLEVYLKDRVSRGLIVTDLAWEILEELKLNAQCFRTTSS